MTSFPEVTNDGVIGDWLIREESDPAFTREEKTIDNSGEVTDLELPSGYPMDDDVPVAASDIANCDGLLLHNTVVPAGQTMKVAVVARGQIVVNRDALPAAYYDTDGAINMGTFATTITALGFIVRREPTHQGEQTT